MIWFALMAVASGPTAQVPKPAAPTVYTADFAPLRKSERSFAWLGPAGPFYPQVAEDSRRSGEAVLRCRAGMAGALERCRVVSETPTGFHFGDAASVMAERKRIMISTPVTKGDDVEVRVPFVIGAPAAVEP